ncbi:hypothetical protein [Oribacterium sp. WCC10]|uniref:hypothetical protein n=1 Tax=Oribacterium sp. WCC10 TaxID=1855343 RepID=UPI0008E7FE0B|nr:hypothetical protein [Oribacterium sp. WCC10]SFG06541.1 hypothetical protein SAMN05216356_10159 [Oribacterium sp. WCC10]
MKNTIKLFLATAGVVCNIASFSFAGSWGKDSNGWYYLNDDGTYATSGWQWIDGNNDGTAECYCFDAEGYLYTNTMIDDAKVDSNGAWIQDGVVQTKQISTIQGIKSWIDGTYECQYQIDYQGEKKKGNESLLTIQSIDENHIKVTTTYTKDRVMDVYTDGFYDVYTRDSDSSYNYTATILINDDIVGVKKISVYPDQNLLVFDRDDFLGSSFYFYKITSTQDQSSINSAVVGRYKGKELGNSELEVDLYPDGHFYICLTYPGNRQLISYGTYSAIGDKIIFQSDSRSQSYCDSTYAKISNGYFTLPLNKVSIPSDGDGLDYEKYESIWGNYTD